jgi:hypothetical protein
LWAYKTLYEHISLCAIDPETEPPTMELPSMIHFEHKDYVASMVDKMITSRLKMMMTKVKIIIQKLFILDWKF